MFADARNFSQTLTIQAAQTATSGEIISRSQIGSDFEWPADDPRLQWQPCREFNAHDRERRERLAQSPYFDLEDFMTRTRHLDTASRILELLNHNAFQFNSRKKFRQCQDWQQRVKRACEAQEPVEILILAFCVISNPTKRVQLTEATLAEDVSLLHLHNLARHIEAIYPPGAVFQVVSDSTFYSLPLSISSVEAQNYLVQLRQRTHDLGIQRNVRILDISDYLAHCSRVFHDRFHHWRGRLLSNPLDGGLLEEEYRRWHASMRATLNSRRMNFNYTELAELFGPDGGGSHDALNDAATLALVEYRALKAASSDTNWEKHHFPGAIRATIHAKKIPVLGLRLYPEYKQASRLLPYHGVALILPTEDGSRERMEIRHEITLIGRPDLTRVVDESGLTLFYEPTRSQP